MKEHPILFSTPMVQALLAGTKTQTRRIMKYNRSDEHKEKGFPGEVQDVPNLWKPCSDFRPASFSEGVVYDTDGPDCYIDFISTHSKDEDYMACLKFPYGKPGDILWVRETWIDGSEYCYEREMADNNSSLPRFFFKADCPPDTIKNIRWKPSIFMPRAACRILLEITEIRVERLQDISEEDSQAEGVLEKQFRIVMASPSGCKDYKIPISYKGAYANLWNNINSKPGTTYEYNPWVWAITFKKQK